MNRKFSHTKTLIETALDEARYGDGAPRWKEGRNSRSCKTAVHAYMDRNRAIRLLERHDEIIVGASSLARRLRQCAPKRRCLSGACPECVRALQRWAVASMADCLRGVAGELGGGQFVAVSIVSTAELIPGRSATRNPFARLRRRLGAALREAKVDFAIGGFDISRNEHADKKFAPHWAPQAWLFMRRDDWREGRAALRRAFPASERVFRPVHGRVFDGNLAGLAYGVKGEFVRRVTLTGDDDRRQNTTLRRLRPSQRVHLLLALNRVGLPARLFFRGAKPMATIFDVAIIPDKRFRRQIEIAAEAQSPPRKHRQSPASIQMRPIFEELRERAERKN